MSTTATTGCVLVVGQHVWGRGKDAETARKNAGVKKRDTYLVYECEDPAAFISNDGMIVHQHDTKNKLVGKFRNGKPEAV